MSSKETLTLTESITFEGETIEVIELDFPALKGKDLAACSRRVRQRLAGGGELPVAVEMDPDFALAVAAVAAGKAVELFDELPAPDYMRVLAVTRNFLFSAA